MNGSHVALLVVGWFGLMAIVNGWIGFESGDAFVAATTGLAGIVLVTTAILGSIREDSLGIPEEPGVLLHVGLLAAGLYAVGTLLRIL